MHSYAALRGDVACDVLVVGAGISGALIADTLSEAGMRVCVIDRREAGWGSTAASTALLQYEIDTELQALVEQVGEDDAVLAYRACAEAVGSLATLAHGLRDVGFRRMRSLYFASKARHERRLRDEGRLRRAHGLDATTLEAAGLRAMFGFDAPVALLTDVAAEVDPYRLAHALLARACRRGAVVHGRTALAAFVPDARFVHATTAAGCAIRCQHLVFAAGYECQAQLDARVARNRSSYAFVSEPVAGGLGVWRDTLIWESARPYLYLRTTVDGRLIVGGLDDGIDVPARRDASIGRKTASLLERVRTLRPDLPLKPAFAWAGTFAETADGLPFFGPHPQHGPRVHFAMAYGGNGITYSAIGAQILLAMFTGRVHPCTQLFSFARLAH